MSFCLSPVGPTQLRKLDTSVGASGPHDFAVRSNISRQRTGDRSQAHHPPCDPIARKTLPRPSHPAPNVRDDRETPLLVGRDGRSCRCDLGGMKTEIFFEKSEIRLDSPVKKPPDGQITTRQRRANSTRVPDAVQRPSRCSAEPGPISTLRDGPRLCSAPLRAALRPGNAAGTAGGLSDVSAE